MAKKEPSPLSAELCTRAKDLRRFFPASVVQDESDGQLRQCRPSSTQRPVLDALCDSEDWLYVGKPRQSHTSTLALLWLLQRTEYHPGRNGLIITNKNETSDELFDRLLTAHKYQPPTIQVPLIKAGIRGGQFSHRGKLKVTTAGGESAGAGFSIDTLVGSEVNLWKDAGPIISKLLPVVAKRKQARVVFESTPGTYGTPQHKLWLSSLQGTSDFRALFIPWWQHTSYLRPVPADFHPDNEELRLLEKYVGMQPGHLMFRRSLLYTACGGDTRLFSNQYPFEDVDGWTTTGLPALPEEPVKALLEDAVATDGTWAAYDAQCRYMLVCDPASFGETGDPSAWTLWNLTKREEVGAWSGRVDPLVLADRLAILGKQYGTALIVVESNAAACIAALIKGGYPKVWQDEKDVSARPGWWASSVDNERATGALARQLSTGQMRVRSRNGLLQLLAFDGNTKRRVQGHHFDRVVTYRIAADMLELLRVAPLREPTTFRRQDGSFQLSFLYQRRLPSGRFLFQGKQQGGTL